MQKITWLFAATVAACTLLAACSSGSQSLSSIPTVDEGRNTATPADLARSGIAPHFWNLIRPLRHAPAQVKPPPPTDPADLFVDDYTTNAVDILKNGSWANVGAISGQGTGINGPDGNYVDRGGRLYVANYDSVDITEYAPGATSPEVLYNAGMIDPVDVAVDWYGNVYEADWDFGQGSGSVKEYRQAINSVVHSCEPGGSVQGVAVDSHGNVFASLNFPTGAGGIVEYVGGLKGCHATKLGIYLSGAGGMAFDVWGNLVVCDQVYGAVDVIAPPYTHITGTLGRGYADPFHVTINKRNNEAYVADAANGDVFVLSYPSGTLIAELGNAQGLVDPLGAVDGQNFIP